MVDQDVLINYTLGILAVLLFILFLLRYSVCHCPFETTAIFGFGNVIII